MVDERSVGAVDGEKSDQCGMASKTTILARRFNVNIYC